jgi:hypothetical protein
MLHPQERNLVPMEKEAGWAPAMIWLVLGKMKSLVPARTIQPSASYYADFTTTSPYSSVVFSKSYVIKIGKMAQMRYFNCCYDLNAGLPKELLTSKTD